MKIKYLLLPLSFLIGIQTTTSAQIGSPAGIPGSQKVTPSTQQRSILFEDPLWREKVPLQTLIAESNFIVIGTTVSNVSRPTDQPQKANIDYKVKLTEIIKGDLNLTTAVEISMPGGLVKEADGGLLLVKTPWLAHMLNNRTYVIFLKGGGDGNLPLTPLRGSQGIYELLQNGSGVAHLGSTFDPPPGAEPQERTAFLNTLRLLAKSN